jgi:hypothetical protein
MPTTTNALWTITANGAHGPNPQGPQTNLVGCQLAIITDTNGTHYQFQAPGNITVTSPGASLPALPYPFQSFTFNSLTWYIRLNDSIHGSDKHDAHGDWSNVPFGFTATDPDTWTAQAGSGSGGHPEDEEAAAAHG